MKRLTRHLWPAAVLALPAILLASALLTLREFDQLKTVYLRNRAAAIAAQLELLSPERFEALAGEEPGLLELRVFDRDETGQEAAVLEPIWRGELLFQTEVLQDDGEEVFRAYIPFHSWTGAGGGTEPRLRVARIDLAGSAADFLVAHARHNVLVASVSGLALLSLSLYVIWSGRRTARLARRQLELEHLARLGELSAVLAHEIRNPLGTIKGFAQLASEKADLASNALLSPIISETQRLEKLVNDLLLYGRTPEPEIQQADWPALARELESYARHQAGARPVQFFCAATPLRFRSDPALLKQILFNLIRNAAEAAEREVRVMAARHDGGGLVIAVEDDGAGVPEAARARLFEPFFTTKAAGTGLGLSIARKLATALEGRLEIRPLATHGTRAELVFPRMQVEQARTAWQRS